MCRSERPIGGNQRAAAGKAAGERANAGVVRAGGKIQVILVRLVIPDGRAPNGSRARNGDGSDQAEPRCALGSEPAGRCTDDGQLVIGSGKAVFIIK